MRTILAELGLDHPRELTGRVDLVRQKVSGNPRWDRLELADLLTECRVSSAVAPSGEVRRAIAPRATNLRIVEACREAIEGRSASARVECDLTNADFAVGATLAGQLAAMKHHDFPSPLAGEGGERGNSPPPRLPSLDFARDRLSGGGEAVIPASHAAGNYHIEIVCKGCAGHGFAFAATRGIQLTLAGYANDAVAEVMSEGARVVITAPEKTDTARVPHLIGNAAAYGATGGSLYVAGRAGQRFGVRNSGARLVCEGVGKYAFEYMTGGVGVVLGPCGPCIGSGMTGGELYLYDPSEETRTKVHTDVVGRALDDNACEETLKSILADYCAATRNPRAAALLEHWSDVRGAFVRVVPK